MKGLIFNIQRFSIHDGPGIRSTVFFKGCNLRCFWCHNPESIHPEAELQIFPHKCIGCGKCFEVCPVHAHQMQGDKRVFLREMCLGCGKCTESCYAEALVMAGRFVSVGEVLEEVEKDRVFYENSGGGVTFSGGEALLQKDFLKNLLLESKKLKLHTAVDTAGNVPWETFEEILPYVDLFIIDVKVADMEKHKEVTGLDNRRILDNLKKLSQKDAEVWIRVPVIPGVNDNTDEMEKITYLIKDMKNIKLVELLPFHRMGEGKYESLGMEYKAKGFGAPSEEQMAVLKTVFSNQGLPVKK